MRNQTTLEETTTTVAAGSGEQSVGAGTLSSERDLAALVPAATLIVGRISAILQSAGPLVDFPTNASGGLVRARSLVPVTEREIGKDVALAFEENDPAKPIILGILQGGGEPPAQSPDTNPTKPLPQVQLDGDALIISAKREIVLRCGKSSITLTSAGKVLIRGTYLLNRSSGVNRIKGGSVQIN